MYFKSAAASFVIFVILVMLVALVSATFYFCIHQTEEGFEYACRFAPNQIWEKLTPNCELAGKFRCKNGDCIDLSRVCNVVIDCRDGSDETEFLCRQNITKNIDRKTENTHVTEINVTNNINNVTKNIISVTETTSEATKSTHNVTDNTSNKTENKNHVTESTLNVTEDTLNMIESTDNATCEPLISTSVKITCFYGEKRVDCNNSMRPGTIAVMVCDPEFKPFAAVSAYNNYCQESGNWFYPMPDCSYTDCPTVSNEVREAEDYEEKTETKTSSIYQQNAMVYYLDNDETIYKAMGTLITQYCVLTSIEFETNNAKTILSRLRVTLSQRNRNLLDSENTQIQVFQVAFAHRYEANQSALSDITILQLAKSAKSTDEIALACPMEPHQHFDQNEALYKTIARHIITSSSELEEIPLAYLKSEECNNFLKENSIMTYIDTQGNNISNHIEDDEFCAYNNDTEENGKIENIGAGFFYEYNKIQLLVGISQRVIDNPIKKIFVFSDLRKDALFNFINTTTASIRLSNERKCQPISPTNLRAVVCFYDGHQIPCSGEMPIGSVVRSSCISGNQSSKPNLHLNYCQLNGEWLYPVAECISKDDKNK